MRIIKSVNKFRLTAFATIAYLIILIYPLSVTIFLNPPPEASQLERVAVTIKKVGEGNPTLKTITSEGERLDFELPPIGYSITQGFSKNRLFYNKRTILENCSGSIEFDRMHFVFLQKPLRIWAINCGNFSLSFQDSLSRYERTKSLRADLVLFLFGSFIWFMCFYADWIKR